MLTCLLAAAALAACGGTDEPELRSGESLFEAPTFRFVVPEGWSAGLDDDPSADDQVNLRKDAVGQRRPVQASLYRLRHRGEPTSLRERVERAHGDADGPSNVVSVTALERLDHDVDGEAAWAYGTTYDDPLGGRFRTSLVKFDHGDSEYSAFFEAPADRFDEEAPALSRILETWRFE